MQCAKPQTLNKSGCYFGNDARNRENGVDVTLEMASEIENEVDVTLKMTSEIEKMGSMLLVLGPNPLDDAVHIGGDAENQGEWCSPMFDF